MHQHEAYALCRQHMNRYVRLTMADGNVYDGVIENVDGDHVYMVCPVMDGAREERYFPYGGFGPGFGPGFYPGFGYPRFRRFALPLAGLTALALFPYWWI